MLQEISRISIMTLAVICILGISVPAACSPDDKIITEYRITDFSDASGWKVTTLRGNASNSAFEKGVLKCDFSTDPGYVGIGGGLGEIAGIPSEIILTYQGDKSGHPIVLRFQDSAGQYFQKQVDILDTDDVKTVRMPLGDMNTWHHFGGADDGVVRPPIRPVEIIIDRNGPDASVRLIELKAKTEIPVDQGLTLKIVNRKQENDRDVLEVEFSSILPWKVKAIYSWQVMDFFGPILDSGEQKINLFPSRPVRRYLTVPHDGAELCEFWLTADVPVGNLQGGAPKPLKPRTGANASVSPEMVQVTKILPTSVVDLHPGGSPKLIPDSPYGMGIYLGQRWPSTEMEKPAQMAEHMGIKWMRDEFNWGHVEPEKGKWNFERFDASVETATRHGVSIFGLLCYWAPWAKPHTEEGIQDYCNYVKTVVGRYKDRIKYWEIWNEPNIFFWTGTIEQYTTLLKAAYDAVKEADPEAKVIGCCTAGTDLNFIEQVFKFGGFDKMDILSIHPYRYPPTPEETGFIEELKKADALVRKYGAPKEIWITEIGWPTNIGGNGSSEAKQAAMIVRTYLQAIASGVVQKVFWYNYRNDGMDVFYNEHNFGIMRRDHSPKPACVAFQTMTSNLEGKKFVKDLSARKGVYAYLFEGENERTIAAWCASGYATLSVKGEVATITHLTGRNVPAVSQYGRMFLAISENPVFMSGVKADVNVRVTDVIDTPEGTNLLDLAKVTVLPLSPSKFSVEIAPVYARKNPLNVTVRIPGYVDSFKVTKQSTETYDLPQGMMLNAEKELRVSVTVESGEIVRTKRSKVFYAPSRRVSSIEIDGKLDEWDLSTPLTIGKPGHVQELETGAWTGTDDLSADIWTAWDDSYFYIAAKVKDDAFSQKGTGDSIWTGDSVQFALDPLHLEAEGLGGIYEIGMAQTPDGPQVYSWYAPEGGKTGFIKGAKLVVVREGDYTVYEAAIPLSELAPLKPEAGKTVGFSMVVNDDDGNGRKSWLEWSSGIGREKLPSLYGDITFTR